jgi:pantothenate kinase
METAKHRVQENTKKHVVYPEACDSKPVYCYAYWFGVQVVRHEHGNTIIFSCGDPGSGKSTSVNSIVHTTARLETAA